MYTASVVEIGTVTRMRENRAVGMAGYQDLAVCSCVGAKLLFDFFYQLLGTSCPGRGLKPHKLQRPPHIADQKSSEMPQLIVQQASLVTMDEKQLAVVFLALKNQSLVVKNFIEEGILFFYGVALIIPAVGLQKVLTAFYDIMVSI